eukprot:COSAG03_NODE_1432_length_4089_cov_11.519298_3_plen_164_part_00
MIARKREFHSSYNTYQRRTLKVICLRRRFILGLDLGGWSVLINTCKTQGGREGKRLAEPSVAAREDTSSGRSGKAAAKAAANPFPSRRGSSSIAAKRRRIAEGSRSELERLPRAGLAIPGEAGHETRGVGGAYTEPPDGGREMRWRAPLCSGARNGQTLDKPG